MLPSYPDLFKGTAQYYARFRPGYPTEMIEHVVERFGLDGTGRLLDLGCGTGQLLIPFAPFFETAVGMDPEPEMLVEAQRVVVEAGIENATWIEGGSLDLGRLRKQIEPLRLTTIGRAFHWMDADTTLAALAEMTEAGGGIVQCGEPCEIWTGQRAWQVAAREVIQCWLGTERRAGSGTFSTHSERVPWSEGSIFARSPFRSYEHLRISHTRELDIDSVVGYLYSMSFASPVVLGDRRAEFERDLREALADLSPHGPFIEELVLDTYLAWKT